MSKPALIVIDIQNDYFPGGKWPLAGVEAAADNAARLIAAARQAGELVVHVRHEFADADAPFFAPGSTGAQLHPKVLNRPEEPVVLKHAVNAFHNTELKALLEQHNIDELVIAGSMSNMCIEGATRAAADFGYPVTVIHDACACRELEFDGQVVPAQEVHLAAMASLAFAYAKVLPTDEFLASRG
jgi:nicotinamidase-related amidase